jgi:hypothetical protein
MGGLVEAASVMRTGTAPARAAAGDSMTDNGTRYETRTVRTIRGTESRTASKWEKEGWEVVSQSQGKLQTELTLRRPKANTRWRTPAIIGGGLAVLLIVGLIVNGIISERTGVDASDDGQSQVATATATTSASASASTDPSGPEATASAGPENATVTRENNTEFSALLALTDYCDPSIAAFADKYRDQTVEFDGYVGAINNHEDASTRYDILIGAGNFSETSAPGPAFQFRDVHTTTDLHSSGNVPETIGVGTEMGVAARIGEYEPASCLLLREPIETMFQ